MSEDAHNPDGSPPSHARVNYCNKSACSIIGDYRKADCDLLTVPGYVTYQQSCPTCHRTFIWNRTYTQVLKRVLLNSEERSMESVRLRVQRTFDA